MIFNPYDIDVIMRQPDTGCYGLQLSPALLINNSVVVTVVLLCLLMDVLAWRQKGVMWNQLAWIVDTRSARTLEITTVYYPWFKPLLLAQYFVFFGLSAFCLYDADAATHLSHPDVALWKSLLTCVGLVLGWYLLQQGLFNWFCYLFGYKMKKFIINCTYKATFILLSPVATLCFVGICADWMPDFTAVILLASLFILSQFLFIFNGFKIFYEGFGSACIIILYLCTLEIAPLLVILGNINI